MQAKTTYAQTLLSDGERITMRSRQHWLAILLESRRAILFVLAAIVVALIGGALNDKGPVGQVLLWAMVILYVIGLGWIALIVANWFNQEYLVTNRRVIKVDGLINKHAADSSLEKINDAVLDQNLFGRMFHYGDLDIITANETEVDKYKMLNHVIEFKREILNQKHDLEFEGMRPPSPPARAVPVAVPTMAMADAGGGAAVAPMGMGGPAPARMMSAAEVTAALGSLADLRDRGAITPEEFEAKKADLLGRL